MNQNRSEPPDRENIENSQDSSPAHQSGISAVGAMVEPNPAVASPGIDKIGLLFDKVWWKATLDQIWTFRALTLKPAILVTLGEICSLISLYLSYFDLYQLSASGTAINGLGELGFIFLKAIVVMLLFGGAALVLTCWGAGLWFVTLTGFCRSFLTTYETPPGEEALLSDQKKAVDYILTKKMTLLITWIFYSLIMIIPMVVFAVSLFFVLVSIPNILPYPVPFTPLMIGASGFVCFVTLLILTNLGLLTMPLSAVSNLTGREIATGAFMMTFKTLPAITVCSVLAIVLSLVMSIPDIALISFNNIDKTPSNYLMQALLRIVFALFHGAASIFILPLCLALPCELLRKGSRQ